MTPIVRGNAEVEATAARRTLVSASMPICRGVPVDRQSGNSCRPTMSSARAFVVLGRARDELCSAARIPLGQRLRIGGLHFRVIGVMAEGQFLGIDLDDTASIPAARARSCSTARASTKSI